MSLFSTLLSRTADFIATHRHERPETVALLLANRTAHPATSEGATHGGTAAHAFSREEAAFIVRQIEGFQKLSHKVPQWASLPQLVYPPRISLEQCSSQHAALYKAKIVQSLLSALPSSERQPTKMADLTGGLGVDFSFLAPLFNEALYIEQREELVALAQHNFPLLGLSHAHCVCGDGANMLSQIGHLDLLYIDPARRDENGRKTVRIEDCTPNILSMLATLRAHARWLLIKLSPMLDVHQAVAALGCVQTVHIVAVGGECKEILLLCQGAATPTTQNASSNTSFLPHSACTVRPATPTQWICASEKGEFVFTTAEEQTANCPLATHIEGYLYEPDAAVMKGGAFKTFALRFGLQKLHPNTHLYVSNTPQLSIPARCFRILEVVSFQKKALRGVSQLKKANLAIRNFPASVAELRKRLKLSEGGEHYLFACTTAQEEKVIIIAEKVSESSK